MAMTKFMITEPGHNSNFVADSYKIPLIIRHTPNVELLKCEENVHLRSSEAPLFENVARDPLTSC